MRATRQGRTRRCITMFLGEMSDPGDDLSGRSKKRPGLPDRQGGPFRPALSRQPGGRSRTGPRAASTPSATVAIVRHASSVPDSTTRHDTVADTATFPPRTRWPWALVPTAVRGAPRFPPGITRRSPQPPPPQPEASADPLRSTAFSQHIPAPTRRPTTRGSERVGSARNETLNAENLPAGREPTCKVSHTAAREKRELHEKYENSSKSNHLALIGIKWNDIARPENPLIVTCG